jgi:hypothetical protein
MTADLRLYPDYRDFGPECQGDFTYLDPEWSTLSRDVTTLPAECLTGKTAVNDVFPLHMAVAVAL